MLYTQDLSRDAAVASVGKHCAGYLSFVSLHLEDPDAVKDDSQPACTQLCGEHSFTLILYLTCYTCMCTCIMSSSKLLVQLQAREMWNAVSTLAEMSILDLAPVIAGSVDNRITWFQQRSLLANSLNCPACGAAMQMQTRNDIQDKRRYFWNHHCLKYITALWRILVAPVCVYIHRLRGRSPPPKYFEQFWILGKQ